MKTADLFQEALLALGANRLRSALTILGIVIGVASVILMMAIGEGSKRNVAQSISSLGANTIIVNSGAGTQGGLRGSAGGLPTLTLDDAVAIGELQTVKNVAPVSNSQAQVVFGGNNKSSSITGTTPAYFIVNSMKIAEGSAFTDTDVRTSANVAVVGDTVVRELFAGQSPIGQIIRIQRQTFTVVGKLEAKGQGFGGQDQDDVVVIPVTTAQRKLSGSAFPNSVSTIMAESNVPEMKGYTEQEITLLLRQRHRIAPGADDDFSVRNMSSVTATLESVSAIISILLLAVASICLFVGGIGIMNIMLVSVSERTREIGIRMALGGPRRTILMQFLLESVALSLVGGLAGVLLGVGAGLLVGMTGAVTAVFSTASIVISFSMALAVGVGFGYWPAVQASKLEPVEALRYQ
ncbi:MAG: ABC transporter permease [Burkholderiaceae bacterium]